ncbi:hypothetical protein DVH24_025122 [Malus domestica]|uniref:Uncharacterized protein n=1 Tax=Malus domestica TaxID=3750 RepID=A0A498HR43_MALDO|nr:hypothetical protein DVH24_025122 [Malus domestica]
MARAASTESSIADLFVDVAQTLGVNHDTFLCSCAFVRFTAGFTLVQDPSDFVHQHLAPSVINDTKSYVGSLSFFSSHHRETSPQYPP